jgi:hypothetical protein
MKIKFFILPLFLTGLSVFFPACAPQKISVKTVGATEVLSSSSRLVSDTLYFGTSTAKGPVTAKQWDSFLGLVVTPRFPDGLTVWDAQGQWRGKSGIIGKENTKVLLLIHPNSPDSNRAIQEIIDAYKKKFRQESVMKVRSLADVSF